LEPLVSFTWLNKNDRVLDALEGDSRVEVMEWFMQVRDNLRELTTPF
jgi:hypothetical protein